MNCTDFELEAQRLLDERVAALPPALGAHAADCVACRTFWKEQLMLAAAARSWTPVPPPSDLIQSVLAALSQPELVDPRHTEPLSISVSPRRASQGSAWAALCSTAALVLLTLTVVQLTPPRDPHETPVAVATNTPEAIDSEDALVSQTLAGLWQGMHAEYRELSQETARVLDGLDALPETSTILPELPSAESPSKPPSSWLRLARPVSDRVGQAFDFLRDAVPEDSPQSS